MGDSQPSSCRGVSSARRPRSAPPRRPGPARPCSTRRACFATPLLSARVVLLSLALLLSTAPCPCAGGGDKPGGGGAPAQAPRASISRIFYSNQTCAAGNGTASVTGCIPGGTLRLQGNAALSGASMSEGSLHLQPANPEEPATGSCRILSRGDGVLLCVLSDIDTSDESTVFHFLLGGKSDPDVTVGVVTEAAVTTIRHDRQRCSVLAPGDVSCMPGALLTLRGTGLQLVRSVSLNQQLRDVASHPTQCPLRSGWCTIVRRTALLIACRVTLSPANYSQAACVPREPPLMGIALTGIQRSTPLSAAFSLMDPPVILQLHSTAGGSNGGCAAGDGTLRLEDCRNGTEVVLSGAFLRSGGNGSGSGGGDTEVLASGRQGQAGCAITHESFSQISCVFSVEGGWGGGGAAAAAGDAAAAAASPATLTQAPGEYSLSVVTSAGDSEESASLFLAPFPEIRAASFSTPGGCAAGNGTLSLTGCANNTLISLSGAGFGFTLGPRSSGKPTRKIRVSVTGIPPPPPPGAVGGGETPVPALQHTTNCSCHLYRVLLPRLTRGGLAEQSVVWCALSCPEGTVTEELEIRIESGGVRAAESVRVTLHGPPVVTPGSALCGGVEVGAATATTPSPTTPPRCRSGDVITLQGSGFLGVPSVVLVPLSAPAPGFSLFSEAESGGAQMLRPHRGSKAAGSSGARPLNSTCLVDASVTNATHLSCTLGYSDLPQEGIPLYAVYVKTRWGISLPLSRWRVGGAASPKNPPTSEDVTGFLDTVPAGISQHPVVTLVPSPVVSSLYGCVNTREAKVIMKTCFLRHGTLLSVSGSGFDPEGNRTTVELSPASDGNVTASVGPPPVCVVSQVMPTMLTCVMEVQPQHFGLYDVTITTPGGHATKNASVQVVAKPHISSLKGCTSSISAPDTPHAAAGGGNASLGSALGEMLGLHLGSNATAKAQHAGNVTTPPPDDEHPVSRIICKNEDTLLVHGAGFDADLGINIVIRNKHDNSYLKEHEMHLTVVDRNTLSVAMRHRYAYGTEYELRLQSLGGDASHSTHIELVPLPVLKRITNAERCTVRGMRNPVKSKAHARRRTDASDDEYNNQDDADEEEEETTVQSLVCVHGAEVELHGRNFYKVHSPVLFTLTNADPAEEAAPQQAAAEPLPAGGTPSPARRNVTVPAAVPITAPCHIVTQSATVIKCRLMHTFQSGNFFPLVSSLGGHARLAKVDDRDFPGVELIPLPVIAHLAYRKGGQCLEGNMTKGLQGCQSGTLITIAGFNFANTPKVSMRAGGEGGTNGPPECWVTSTSKHQLVCLLDHTSAAGSFELTVKDQYGESITKATVSVIPGNLYLLFKNTGLVLAVSNTVGWVCSVLWTGSMATLAWSTEKARSTAGISPDMVLYNVVGLLGWNVFCIYFYIHDELGVPIFIQDIAYSTTSYLIVLYLCGQLHRFGSQGFTTFAKLYCTGLVLLCAKIAVDTRLGERTPDVVSALGKVHLACAVVKYMPQVRLNYVRKSTEGYSIAAVWLDFGGAVLLMVQMFFDGIIRHKWSLMITLNVPKFALCCEVILFNIIYACQHYILYPGRRPLEVKQSSYSPTASQDSPSRPKRQRITEGTLYKRPPGEGSPALAVSV